MKPLRILVVGQTPPPYGGQTVMIQYLLDGIYHDIEFVHVRTNFSKELKSAGKFAIGKMWELIRVVFAIYLARIKKRPQVLYYPPAGPHLIPVLRDIVLLCATRWLFNATVFHFHAGGIARYSERLNPVLRRLFWLAFAKPELVIRTAGLAAQDGQGLCCKKKVIIPNGIPDSARTSIRRMSDTGEPIRILFVALLREDKGIFVAIDAVRQLLMMGMNVELICIGEWDSPGVQARARLMIEETFRPRFKFPGVQIESEKWEFYKNADVFLFPSFFHSETFGLVLVEAMCFSLPIVATRWSGIPEVVRFFASRVMPIAAATLWLY
jgi:glycosyltransferase involved in cell wall biosynthesis